MSLVDDIAWFKATFGDRIRAAVAGTPFTLDLITALAVQETHEVWGRARKKWPAAQVLALCVGDIIDASGGRRAFPKSRAALEAVPHGKEMFAIARQSIEDMASVAPEYKKYLKNPNKFAHAFGLFQYDIQAFPRDPDFFLHKQWHDFDKCLAKCVAELSEKLQGKWARSLRTKAALGPKDLVYLAVAYNKGSAKVGAGFKQGFKSGGKYYGELIDHYMQLAKQVA